MDIRKVKKLIEMLENSNLEEIEIQEGEESVRLVKSNGNISNINFYSRKIDFYELIIDIEVRDKNHLNNIIAALRLLKEISSLERVKGW